MKKAVMLVLAAMLLFPPSIAQAHGRKGKPKHKHCVKIAEGKIMTSDEEIIKLGYDKYGYNYQAHKFKGFPGNVSRPEVPVTSSDIKLTLKWNNAYLSNTDCDKDMRLDRHYGYESYIGSGAWFTNKFRGSYVGDDGREHHWWLYVKIAAKPTAEYSCGHRRGSEYDAEFCQVEYKLHDPYGGYPDSQNRSNGFAPGPGRAPGPVFNFPQVVEPGD